MEIRMNASRFEAVDNDQVVGWLDFEPEGDSTAMTHTIVPEQFGGRGIGGLLVIHALKYARDNGWTVLPYCSFIQSYIASHREYVALVPADRRAQFSLPVD
ncbi:MAG: N-acetyltransferase [Propionibacteriaceae bacterium]|nr:N-acetyltransferase [Propionibacteriaceae bacterium]